jgi:hypothetical protein
MQKAKTDLAKPTKIFLVHNNIPHKHIVTTHMLSSNNQTVYHLASTEPLTTTSISKAHSKPAICYTTPQKPPFLP